MEYQYKLSIITINLNNREGLQKTIDSVINQTFKDFEWIIIDGGSLDGSKELIEKYSEHINYWVSEPDKGIYNAMNKGIMVSHGKYLLFLNSGDTLHEANTLKEIIYELIDDYIYIGNEKLKNGKVKTFNIKSDNDIIKYLILHHLPHQSTFIPKKLFNDFGLYREDLNITSDHEKFIESIIWGNYKTKHLDKIISVYDTTGISSDKIKLKEELNLLKITRSRFYFILEFYLCYNEIIQALLSNKYMFFLFRVYFFFYRKFNKY